MVEVVEMGISSISLSWSVPGDSVVVVSSEVVWRVVSGSHGESVASSSSGTLSSTDYTIPDLQELSVYNITVTINTQTSGSFTKSVIYDTVMLL